MALRKNLPREKVKMRQDELLNKHLIEQQQQILKYPDIKNLENKNGLK